MISRGLSDVTLFCLLRKKFPLRTSSNWMASLQSGCATGACSCSEYCWPSHSTLAELCSWVRVRHLTSCLISDGWVQWKRQCEHLDIQYKDPSQRPEMGEMLPDISPEILSLESGCKNCLISLQILTECASVLTQSYLRGIDSVIGRMDLVLTFSPWVWKQKKKYWPLTGIIGPTSAERADPQLLASTELVTN